MNENGTPRGTEKNGWGNFLGKAVVTQFQIFTSAPNQEHSKLYLRREKDLSASKSTSKKKRNRATSFEDFSPIPTRNNKKLSHGSLQGKTMKVLDIFKRVCRIPFIFLFYSSVKEFYPAIRQRSCLFLVDLFKRQKKLRSLFKMQFNREYHHNIYC